MSRFSTLEVKAEGERGLVMHRSLRAPQALAFRCFTEPDLVKQWMGSPRMPMTSCEIELKVGGKLRYVWSNAEGRMVMTGRFVEVDAPRRERHTELFDEDWTGGEAEGTTDFVIEDDATTTVVMTMLYASAEARDRVLASPMADGMEDCFAGLDGLLAKGAFGG